MRKKYVAHSFFDNLFIIIPELLVDYLAMT